LKDKVGGIEKESACSKAQSFRERDGSIASCHGSATSATGEDALRKVPVRNEEVSAPGSMKKELMNPYKFNVF
jgi:hypothetical protein